MVMCCKRCCGVCNFAGLLGPTAQQPNSPTVPVPPDVRLYLLFYDADQNKELSHSTALNKGCIGRVNLFGDRAHTKQNLVIAVHKLLHALTATDKYDLHTGLPIYLDGYADPDKQP
jgi:hypothetical protein